jgi:hypothetical protein
MRKNLAQGRRKQRSSASDYSIRIDDETADDIRAFALRMNVSFGEAVRTLCTWGLESERQST